jgi:hypothetical protein
VSAPALAWPRGSAGERDRPDVAGGGGRYTGGRQRRTG